MTPDDLRAIEVKMAAANTILYRTWGEEDRDAEYDIETLVAALKAAWIEIERLKKELQNAGK